MHYLIDGYNLMYAMGILRGRVGPTGLEKARLRLLGYLRGAHGADAAAVTVVFDAAGGRPGSHAEQLVQGMHVYFAIGKAEADDLIEELIEHASAPRNLTVISNDHRIQRAARRRQCVVQGCEAYLTWLEERQAKRTAPKPAPGGKPEGVSRDETQHWLAEFADLEEDPKWKELFGIEDEFEKGTGPV